MESPNQDQIQEPSQPVNTSDGLDHNGILPPYLAGIVGCCMIPFAGWITAIIVFFFGVKLNSAIYFKEGTYCLLLWLLNTMIIVVIDSNTSIWWAVIPCLTIVGLYAWSEVIDVKKYPIRF